MWIDPTERATIVADLRDGKRVYSREVRWRSKGGEERTILFNLCGHGCFDLSAYDSYLSGSMQDHEHPQSEIEAALAKMLKQAPKITVTPKDAHQTGDVVWGLWEYALADGPSRRL